MLPLTRTGKKDKDDNGEGNDGDGYKSIITSTRGRRLVLPVRTTIVSNTPWGNVSPKTSPNCGYLYTIFK